MATWIVLLRGINVGGNNILPMAALKSDLEALGLANVRTYIQSGNVLFNAASGSVASLRTKIAERIETQHGFRPQLMVMSRTDLQAAISDNPFPEAGTDPKTLHFFFLDRPATSPDSDGLEKARAATEAFALRERVFYLHAPEGIGRSRLAANAEKLLGVVTTARNLRTVEKLAALADT